MPSFNFAHPKQTTDQKAVLTDSSPYRQLNLNTKEFSGTTPRGTVIRTTGFPSNIPTGRLVASPIRNSSNNVLSFQPPGASPYSYRLANQAPTYAP